MNIMNYIKKDIYMKEKYYLQKENAMLQPSVAWKV